MQHSLTDITELDRASLRAYLNCLYGESIVACQGDIHDFVVGGGWAKAGRLASEALKSLQNDDIEEAIRLAVAARRAVVPAPFTPKTEALG